MRPRRKVGEGADGGADAVRADDPRTRERDDRAVVCDGCGHAVSSTAARIDVAGRHEHRCVNPHGFVFRIGCYREAPGMARRGLAVAEHSWFSGYAWQIALCSRCSAHLGWAFSGASPSFYALIVDRVHEA
jgi:hypothetical protein